MAEDLIRGGVASVFNKRLATAKNKFVENFDPTHPSTVLFMIDANNLSAGIMGDFVLPLKSLEFNDKITLDEIMNTSEDSDIEFIL